MRRLLVGLAALSLLTFAGCRETEEGSADVDDIPTTVSVTTSSSSSTSAPANEQATAPSIAGPVEERGRGDATDGAVEIDVEDFAFDPTYIRANEGARVTVSLRNSGEAPHTFTMAGQGVDQQLAPGATAQVTVALPQSGPAVFVCTLHERRGMKGAFFFG